MAIFHRQEEIRREGSKVKKYRDKCKSVANGFSRSCESRAFRRYRSRNMRAKAYGGER